MKTTINVLFFITSLWAIGQTDVKTLKPENDTISHWQKTNKIGFDLTEVAYINWSTGGNSSISGLLNGHFTRNFKKELLFWNNELRLNYGLNQQQGRELRKTEDLLAINSTFGFRNDSLDKIYYTSKISFQTQFAPGYRYPNTEFAISNFMAPAYLFIGSGIHYFNKDEKFQWYYSPATLKSTFVLNQRLANEGAFGVTPAVFNEQKELIKKGRRSNTEFGMLMTVLWDKKLFTNIHLIQRLSLYTDYIKDFGNIDIDWELTANLIVNKYVKATLGTHLKYDDHIKHQKDSDGDGVAETGGPKVQFRQLLAVGMVYTF